MAIRRVTRYVSRNGVIELNGNGRHACTWASGVDKDFNLPVTIEYDDGKEEPQVKTRERRFSGNVLTRPNYPYQPEPDPNTFSVNLNPRRESESLPAVLVVTEPVPEPTLAEVVEAYCSPGGGATTDNPMGLTRGDLKAALDREKQKSTR
jgi:hypothetical protein